MAARRNKRSNKRAGGDGGLGILVSPFCHPTFGVFRAAPQHERYFTRSILETVNSFFLSTFLTVPVALTFLASVHTFW